jgi:hypothetical protein
MGQACKKIFEKGHAVMHEDILVKKPAEGKPRKTTEATSRSSPRYRHAREKRPVERGQGKNDPSMEEDGNCNPRLGKVIMNYKKYGFFI